MDQYSLDQPEGVIHFLNLLLFVASPSCVDTLKAYFQHQKLKDYLSWKRSFSALWQCCWPSRTSTHVRYLLASANIYVTNKNVYAVHICPTKGKLSLSLRFKCAYMCIMCTNNAVGIIREDWWTRKARRLSHIFCKYMYGRCMALFMFFFSITLP